MWRQRPLDCRIVQHDTLGDDRYSVMDYDLLHRKVAIQQRMGCKIHTCTR